MLVTRLKVETLCAGTASIPLSVNVVDSHRPESWALCGARCSTPTLRRDGVTVAAPHLRYGDAVAAVVVLEPGCALDLEERRPLRCGRSWLMQVQTVTAATS
jgi:hypothetical protein